MAETQHQENTTTTGRAASNPDHGTTEGPIQEEIEAHVGDLHETAEHTPAAHDDHGLYLGRHVDHPPEPPHFIQLLYKQEMKTLTKKYMKEHPEVGQVDLYEPWLKIEDHHAVHDPETGAFVAEEGESPSMLQAMHIGVLKKPAPIIGYAPWENHVFYGIGLIVTILIFFAATMQLRRNRLEAMKRPSRGQSFIEWVVAAFDNFCTGILGSKYGRHYMPYIGTLFCVILVCNLMGLVPFMKASTSSWMITGSLALCTFLYVQWTAWTKLGPFGYIYHLMGQPKDVVGWVLAPFMMVLEIISELAKPLSLSLRLFGNVLGKDILLGVMILLGIGIVKPVSESLAGYFGLPFTIPFYFLGLLLSSIQALIFAVLSIIYILLVLPHDEHEHEEDHAPSAPHPMAPGKDVASEPLPS